MYKNQATVLLSSQDFYGTVGDEGVLLEFTNVNAGPDVGTTPNNYKGTLEYQRS